MKQTFKRVKFTVFSEKGDGEKRLIGEAENCNLTDGKLRSAFHVVDGHFKGRLFVLPQSHYGSYRFATIGEDELYVSGQGSLYVYAEASASFLNLGEGIFPQSPTVLSVFDRDGTEKLAFCSGSGVYIYDPTLQIVSRFWEKGSIAACVFHDRIFTAAGNTLYFCAPLEYENWADDADGGGHVDFPTDRGEIVGLWQMGEYIYVFFKRGIIRLSAGGAARDFEAKHIAYDGGDILLGTVCPSGRYAAFFTAEGIFRFDGKKVERISDERFPAERYQSTTFEGKAYISAFYEGKATVAVVDAERESRYLLCANGLDGVSESHGRLYFSVGGVRFMSDENGGLPDGAYCSFKVRSFDFGVLGEKLLKRLTIKGAGSCRVAVSGEREGHSYLVSLDEGAASVFPLLKGRRFELTFTPSSDCVVSEIEALVVRYQKGGDVV